MRILQVMPDFDLAGAETMCENLTYELIKNNHTVSIISFFTKKTDITERLEKHGIKVYYLGKKKGPQISMIKKIKKVINEFKPDIIHTHRYCLEYVYPALKLSKFKNVKIVHTVHNIATKEVSKSRRFYRKHFINKKNVIFVAISDIVQKTICEEYKLNPDDVPIVLNGINLDNCIEKNNYKEKNILINIGRISEQKNQKFLIDIFEKIHEIHPNYILKIIGTGPLENELNNIICEKKLKEYIVIEKNKSSCFQDLNDSDIFVMTSKWEGVPMTIIEAMGTGLPVVASNVGGIPNMINNNVNGYILDLDIDAFVNKICELIENEKLREKIGKNAKKRAIIFSSNNMAKKYCEIYERNLSL